MDLFNHSIGKTRRVKFSQGDLLRKKREKTSGRGKFSEATEEPGRNIRGASSRPRRLVYASSECQCFLEKKKDSGKGHGKNGYKSDQEKKDRNFTPMEGGPHQNGVWL